jgi:hypothetical protein
VKSNRLYILVFLISFTVAAQKKDTIAIGNERVMVEMDTLASKTPYDPLAPSRAAFYSAVLPGLGQAYNKKYWKIPIIYAGMATGIYFYIQNDKDYDRFRNAYKRRLAGFTDDEFYGDGVNPIISNDRLIDAQKSAQRNKDLSLVVTVVFYLVNIIDANVDAHLKQFNVTEDLSLEPTIEINSIPIETNYGMSLKYSFN